MRPGDVVGDRFEVESLAGSGGMASVFRARDRQSGAPVALKVAVAEHAAGVDRFVQEARLLAGIAHPNVVRYVAHGVTRSGEPYLAMEWLEGETLAARLARKGLTAEESVSVCRAVADALRVPHRHGAVHRDIKPSNVFLVDRSPRAVKLLDFGVARRQLTRPLTATGDMIGTPGYVSPEQARGERSLDARSDVFALGCVLFECLVGRRAFEGVDVFSVLLKVVLDDAPRVADLRPELSASLDDLVRRMLAKSVDERPTDGGAVVSEIDALGPLGSDLVAPESVRAAALTATERRTVCLVLARTPRSSAPSTRDPSRPVAETEALRRLAERAGGRFDMVADGTVLMTISGADSATELVGRAARFALSAAAIAAGRRYALATGASALTPLPAGDVIGRAVAMLDASDAAEVVLDEVSAALLDTRFEISRGATLALVRERDDDAARTLLGRPTPFVGRERELRMLEGLFEECIEEPVARFALIVGEAGVGKSRLRRELVRLLARRVDAPLVLMGRGDPMTAGSPFGMIAAALRRASGLLDDEPAPDKHRRLREYLAPFVPAESLERLAEFLGEVVRAPLVGEGSVQLQAARSDPILMGDQVRRALEDWLAAHAATRPVLLVLEDLHWGDLPSVGVVDAALRLLAERPLLVVALARQEVHQIIPDLWSSREGSHVQLGGLSRRSAVELARDVLGPATTDEAIARAVDRASGNAFHLEEVVRAIAEGKDDGLPLSIQAVVQSRLEAQSPKARTLLRAASVFGQAFWRGGVEALLGGREPRSQIDSVLETLARAEVVTRRSVSRFADEHEYGFRHGIVRDAAYAMLTDEDRTLGHRLAALWLERHASGEAAVIAEHFERGGEPQRAVAWYVRATDQAIEGNDFAGALARVERGLACRPEGEQRGLLYLGRALAQNWRALPEAARESADDAAALLLEGSVHWCKAVAEGAVSRVRLADREGVAALSGRLFDLLVEPAPPALLAAAARTASHLFLLGNDVEANRLLSRVEQVADTSEHTDPDVLAPLFRARSYRADAAGDPGASFELTELAVAQLERKGDGRAVAQARANLAYQKMEFGMYAEAERETRSVLAAALRMSLPTVVAASKHNLALGLLRLGRLDEGLSVARDALGDYALQNNRRLVGGTRIYVAMILELAGDLEGAEREARLALEDLAETPSLRPAALATLAHVLLSRGRLDEAHASAEEAMSLSATRGYDEAEAHVALVRAETLHALGRREEARAAIAAASGRLRTRAARIRGDRERASFLEAVPENARTLQLADAWEAESPGPGAVAPSVVQGS